MLILGAALVGASVDIVVLNVVVAVRSSLGVGGSVRVVNLPVVGGKELVDLLETPALCLREHEVDDGDPASIENGKDDVRLPADVLESAGGEFDNSKVEDPVRCGGESRTFGPDKKGKDLGGDKPDGGLESEREEEFEDKEHGRGGTTKVGVGGAFLDHLDETGLDTHDGRHSGNTRNEELLASDAVNKEDRDCGPKDEAHVQATCHECRPLAVKTDTLREERSGVVDQGVNAAQLLCGLNEAC